MLFWQRPWLIQRMFLKSFLCVISGALRHSIGLTSVFFEDIKKYPKVHSLLKNYRERDSDSTIEFFKMGIKQGIFRDDVNFAIVNLLVHEQLDLLMNTDICNKYSFLEVYEAIMFTYIRGISTEKGAKVLEDFITEYRKQRIH